MQTEAIPITELDRAEARLPRWMLALACAGTAGCLLAGHARLGASFALGSSVAIVNYYWLHQLVKVLMAAVEPRLSIMAVVKLLLRYPLLVCGAYILYRTGWLPLAPFFVGLFVPVAGAILESVLQIRACWRAT